MGSAGLYNLGCSCPAVAIAGLGANWFAPGMTLMAAGWFRLSKYKASMASVANPNAPPTAPTGGRQNIRLFRGRH